MLAKDLVLESPAFHRVDLARRPHEALVHLAVQANHHLRLAQAPNLAQVGQVLVSHHLRLAQLANLVQVGRVLQVALNLNLVRLVLVLSFIRPVAIMGQAMI